MKKTTIKAIKHTLLSFLIASSIILSSCIGLGKAVDMKGPSVKITNPVARENVKGNFLISGTISDDFAVASATVTLKKSDVFKGEWKYENGAWSYKSTKDGEYTIYTNATWEISENKRNVTWEIKNATTNDEGTFTIIVSASDESGNKSEESTKSIDIIIDSTPPTITITQPVIQTEKKTFDNVTDYKDITKISLFQTGDFTISGNAKDDNQIESLYLVIKDAATQDKYFEKHLTLETEDSLRSWEIPVKLNDCGLNTLDENKHILAVYTNTSDGAGNTNDDLYLQGYLCLWKAADTPWIDFNSLVKTSLSAPYSVYTGSPLQFSAYDDYALDKVFITIRKGNETGELVEKFDNTTLWSSNPEDTDENENIAQITFTPPEDCEQYYVEISAKDKKGNISDKIFGYIKVEDKTFPSVDIEYALGKKYTEGDKLYSSSDTLFGDANGDFTFKLTAYDDTNVKSLKMAYIINKDDVLEYADKTNTLWDSVTTTGVSTDDNNNKRWKINVGNSTGTDGTIGFIRKVFEPTLSLNIFDDLGVQEQTFVFRVEDNNGNAVTKTFSIQGDIEAPKIEFTSLKYYADGKNETPLTANQDLPAFGASTIIVVSGEISDNSSSAWGTCEKMINDGRLSFKITANGSEVEDINYPKDKPEGSFEATIKPAVGASSLTVIGTIKDFANLETTASLSRLVDTTSPKVEYISSKMADGCYTIGDTIDIFVKFNKQMKFSGSTAPTLTLNNNKTATMTSPTFTSGTPSAATDRFTFTYTVKANDDVETLNVKGYDLKGGDITDINNISVKTVLTSQLDELVSGDNLASLKDICVITKVPALQTAVLTESTGELVLTYDKPVAKGSGNITITQLKSNGTKGIEKVPAVLTKSEYNKLIGKNDSFKTYYKAGTNGATEVSGTVTYKKNNQNVTLPKWQFDKSEKYILDYDTNTNNGTLTGLFEGVNAHILSQNIKSNKVSLSNGNKTVTILFDVDSETGSCLPCKGAKYILEIPEGFVQDAKGGDKFKVAAYITDGTTTKQHITAAGYEKPVIRIKTVEATFSDLTAAQPLTSEFKIDWETPGSNQIKYSYDQLTAAATNVTGTPNSIITPAAKVIGTQVPSTNYTTAVSIGSGTTSTNKYKQGETYRITASVMPSSGTTPLATAYNIAYRTTIVGTGMQNKLPTLDSVATSSWLSGGDHMAGPSTTPGFPLNWDATKSALMTKDGNDWYYVTWGINGDEDTRCYIAFLAGTVDSLSGTEGPAKYIYAQNNWITVKKNYGINPGGYLTLRCSDIAFHTGDGGGAKIVTVR